MTTEAIIATIGAVVVLAITGLAAWIKWSIRTAVTSVVEGSLKEVSQAVSRVEAWTAAHDRRHGHEQQQLIAALSRQNIAPPDGWDTPHLGIAREG